jgi:hypothetical protein
MKRNALLVSDREYQHTVHKDVRTHSYAWIGLGEWYDVTGQQSPGGGKINSLNRKHFLRSINFKLRRQIKGYEINVILFQFVVFVRAGLL